MKSDVPLDERIVLEGISQYRELLQSHPDMDVPLDEVLWDSKIPDNMRGMYLRLLLVEERQHRQKLSLPTNFESYWERKWFSSYIDDLVSVLVSDSYRVEGRLGSGGQGRVYKVRNPSVHDRQEALKIFLPTGLAFLYLYAYDEYERLQTRFDRESIALSRLSLEHLPRIHAVGKVEGLRYFTMEYIVGASLANILKEQGTLDPHQVAKLMLTAARTLASLHAEKIIHRDVKPSNFILDKHGKLYLVDFGLVKIMPGATPGGFSSLEMSSLTETHGGGSRGYVAPEQAVNASNITPVADIYGLGATFYHLLNGFQHAVGKIDSFQWAPHIPEPLCEIITKCLRFNPDMRPSALEVVDELRTWLNRPSQKIQLRLRRPTRRQWFVSAGIGAVVVGTGYWLFPRKEKYQLPEIERVAGELRHKYIDKILAARLPNGWFKPLLEPNAPTYIEVYSFAQATYALLSSPELNNTDLGICLRSLSLPFSGEQRIDNQIQIRRRNKISLGWTSRNQENNTFIDPVIWMLSALALGYRRGESEGINDILPSLRENHFKTLQSAQAFYSPQSRGGWNYYPLQTETTKTSVGASALAVQSILEARKSRLSWWGVLGPEGERERDQILNSSLQFLYQQYNPDRVEAPWTGSLDGSPSEADRELSLMVYATLLRADREGFMAIENKNSEMEKNMVNFCLSFAETPITVPGHFLTLKTTATTLSNTVQILEESQMMLWYPWAIPLAYGLLQRLMRQKAKESKLQPLRQALGKWILIKGEEMFRLSDERSFLFQMAENLLGLSSVGPYEG